ncbi:hypothetical protein [Pseudomonas chlororaphis]|uniref:hypothetical protein n=1 Tax=Pseudomonas chlororaphis TaxID=587753 RepID=UPI000F54FD65|nr:hypothetical protein [Pseudomonas chlororaphis]AZD50538.1 hypothetical protein C4K20_5147 [Pseudomonas chlororaphis subsp. aurantiaca]
MSNQNNGGPAFPLTRESSFSKNYEGMTLRDYFAAKAMQGWLATFTDIEVSPTPEGVATLSYQIADAMLATR